MKKEFYKIVGSLVILGILLPLGNTTFSYKKAIRANINMTYLSFLYQGDLYNLFNLKPVSTTNYLTVKDYEYFSNKVEITYLSEVLYSPVEGVVIKKGQNTDKYLIIQSNNYEYMLTGLNSYKVALYQRVYIGDILGSIKENSGEYKCIITNTSANDFKEIALLIGEYDEV